MNKLILSSLVSLSLIKPVFAGPGSRGVPDFTSQEQVVVHTHKTTLSDAYYEVEEELRSGDLSESAFVFDLDGTLTRTSDPSRLPADHVVHARGHSVVWLKSLVERGATVVIASAWNVFDETISRVRALGLAEVLRVDDYRREHFIKSGCGNLQLAAEKKAELARIYSVDSGLLRGWRDTEADLKRKARNAYDQWAEKVEVIRQGNVISCRKVRDVSSLEHPENAFMFEENRYVPIGDGYWRDKHRSLDYLPEWINSPKFVYVFEDSGGNLNIFQRSMSRAAWYPTASHVSMFEFSRIDGDVFPGDIIAEFQEELHLESSILGSRAPVQIVDHVTSGFAQAEQLEQRLRYLSDEGYMGDSDHQSTDSSLSGSELAVSPPLGSPRAFPMDLRASNLDKTGLILAPERVSDDDIRVERLPAWQHQAGTVPTTHAPLTSSSSDLEQIGVSGIDILDVHNFGRGEMPILSSSSDSEPFGRIDLRLAKGIPVQDLSSGAPHAEANGNAGLLSAGHFSMQDLSPDVSDEETEATADKKKKKKK